MIRDVIRAFIVGVLLSCGLVAVGVRIFDHSRPRMSILHDSRLTR